MLELNNVSIDIGSRRIVSGLSFIAADGQLTCLAGPARAGKTTVLRAVLGLVPVSQGFITFDDALLTPASAATFRRLTAWLPHVEPAPERVDEADADDEAAYEWADVLAPFMPRRKPTPRLAPLTVADVERITEAAYQSMALKTLLLADEPRTDERLRRLTDQGKTVVVATNDERLLAMADQVVRLETTPDDALNPSFNPTL